MRKKVLYKTALLLIAACSLIACGSGTSFKKVRPEGAGYAVQSPVTLKMKTREPKAANVTIKMQIYIGEKSGVTYGVIRAEYPEELMKNAGADAVLEAGCKGAASNVNGKVISQEKIKIGGNPGRELMLRGKDADGKIMEVHSRVCLVGNVLYQVMVAGSKGIAGKPASKKFLNSFELVD